MGSARSKKKHVVVSILLGTLLSGCREIPEVKRSCLLMGTIVEITVQHKNPAAAEGIIQEAFNEGERIEKLLSIYEKDSDISRINMKAGVEEVKVSEDAVSCIEHALNVSELSNGAFDITVGPLVELWGFTGEQAGLRLPRRRAPRNDTGVPDNAKIEEILSLVHYRNLTVDSQKNTVRFEKAGMKIDLGGVAKGYAVDRMVVVLKSRGVRCAFVNAGGDIYALGNPSGKKGWKVGIRNPRKRGSVSDVLMLKDKAAATSGDYEKFFLKDGRRYCHIIDPRTGEPVSGVISVTVIAKTAVEADALATALFVMGEESGRELIKKLDDVEAIFLNIHSPVSF